MKLFLLRHAEAHYTSPDARRQLTPYGEQTVRELAQFLPGRIKPDIDSIWHSPLTRAYQTAAIFKQELQLPAELVETNGLTPMDDPRLIIQAIESQPQNILLVGHNPHFESLVAELLGIDPQHVPVNVPKASFLRFRRQVSGWQLRDHLTAKVTAKQSS